MDRARIEEELEKLYPRADRYHDKLSTVSALHFAAHIAKLAREEALEEAAKICDQYGIDIDNEWNRGLGVANDLKETADDCAEAIRALKEQK
jgi:hypothetical protein